MSSTLNFAWMLWFAGVGIILGSWLDLVSPVVGWIGFAVALAGTALGRVESRRSPASQFVAEEADGSSS